MGAGYDSGGVRFARHRVLTHVHSEHHVFAIYHTRLDDTAIWGEPTMLRSVRMRPEDFDASLRGDLIAECAITVMEEHRVDGRNTGPRSKYGQTLAAMTLALAGHVERDNQSMVATMRPAENDDAAMPRRRWKR